MSANLLARESSPYLLQHRDNPVHWRPWGEAAIAEAKATGKPILLSVGYAACHWCHVMAHESFEDETTAAVMNELFVNIKVDREERPDVDAIYMGALHSLGQQGGWPLTMFLDGDARPFWGGTYFPREAQWGRPAFKDVLRRIASIYRDEPAKVAGNAEAILRSLSAERASSAAPEVSDSLIRDLAHRMAGAVDRTHGGIKGAPKFPQWSFFWLLWRAAIRYRDPLAMNAVVTTVTNICQGGIYDHLGGGFARYAVDERWLVPHFEKMLYDNALLIDLLTEVWRETRNPLFATRIEETIAWLEREMIAEGGAFAASLDADSEGEEGKFYVWTADEIVAVLGAEDAAYFADAYDVAPEGNWEGHTILNRLHALELGDAAREARLAPLRAKLLAARGARIRPGWDDKVLADWNGLAIVAIARAASVFDRADWMTLAKRAFTFVTDTMTVDGRLVHAWRNGKPSAPATAADYANMIRAAIRLHEATGDTSYIDKAASWISILDRHYRDPDRGGYATSAADTRDVIVRLRTATDDATPSANATMIANLAALFQLTGDVAFLSRAEETARAFTGVMASNPAAYTGYLAATLDLLAPQLVALVGTDTVALEAALRSLSLPGALELTAGATVHLPPAIGDAGGDPSAARAYVCTGQRCLPPVAADGLRALLLAERSLTSTV